MKVTCSGTNPDISGMWLTSLSGDHLFSDYDASHTQFVELFTVWIHDSSHFSVVFLCSFELFFCYKCSFGNEELGGKVSTFLLYRSLQKRPKEGIFVDSARTLHRLLRSKGPHL